MITPKVLGGLLAVPAISLGMLVLSYKINNETEIKLRGIIHLYNWLKRKPNSESDVNAIQAPLYELFEQVLLAEVLAFPEDSKQGVEKSKRTIFEVQLAGVLSNRNRFSPFGKALAIKELTKNLHRRIKFAETVQVTLTTKEKRCCVGTHMIIIAGLPRTGSTMLHKFLAADATTRTPLWWEQMHDVIPTPTPPSNLLSDPRAKAVVKDLDKLKILSPNLKSEIDKFHKIGAFEVEEVSE